MFVRRRQRDERHINGQYLALEQPGNLRQEDGRKVRSPLLHRLADVVADEQRVVAERAFILRIDVGRVDEGQDVNKFHISQLRRAGA